MELKPLRRTLYAIGEDLLALEELLTELGGDVSDAELEAAIDAWFGALGAERDQKLDSYAALIREMEARAAARREEARRLTALAQVDDNAAKRLKARLLWFFQQHRIDEAIDTPRFRLKKCRAGGKLPLVLDPAAQPEDVEERFRQVTFSFDGDAVRAALDAGEELSFARYGERTEYVRIS